MKRKGMEEQVKQVVIYSEMLSRLLELKELLDPNDGYLSELHVYKKLEELEIEIRKGLDQNLSNAKVSKRASIIISNTQVLKRMESKKKKENADE